MPCTPGQVTIDGAFIFPEHGHGIDYTPVDIPIEGCGLANLDPGPGHVTLGIRTWGIPDANFNWSYTGWWISQDFTLRYESRDDTHLLGVTKYPSHGKINDGVVIFTGYYNPDAYWTPPVLGDPAPPGGDPTATVGQDPTTVDPPVYTVYENRPYKYAVMRCYDQMGINRTGIDLAEDPDNPGTFLDPAVADLPGLSFIYNEGPDGVFSDDTNLANMDWEPDGESTRNQQVSLVSAAKEGARGTRAIARNRTARKEVGVYSGWDAVSGSNVQEVSPENVGGHASAEVERYSRPPNFFKLYLHLEPADEWPERGTDPTPALGWKPQPFRDFGLGDRILARCRKGYIDSGLLVGRIMNIKVSQADANNNVTVELDCVPHATDQSEIEVILPTPDTEGA